MLSVSVYISRPVAGFTMFVVSVLGIRSPLFVDEISNIELGSGVVVPIPTLS